jgi:hypothetical protein
LENNRSSADANRNCRRSPDPAVPPPCCACHILPPVLFNWLGFSIKLC